MNKFLIEDWLRRDKEDLEALESLLKSVIEKFEQKKKRIQTSIDMKKKSIEISQQKLEEINKKCQLGQ